MLGVRDRVKINFDSSFKEYLVCYLACLVPLRLFFERVRVEGYDTFDSSLNDGAGASCTNWLSPDV